MIRNISTRYLIFLVFVFGNAAKNLDENFGSFEPVTRQPLRYLPQPRIVGGQDAKDNQFPHQISLRLYNQHICGGSIISENHVLTAAHCVCTQSGSSIKKFPISIMTIHAGSRDVNSGGVVAGVDQTFVHPKYKDFENDIAVVKLKTSLKFNEMIQPIALATQRPKTGVKVVTSGWGGLQTNGDTPEILQFNTLVLISNAQCRRRIGNVPTSMLCLGHTEGNGVCSGDSGGPAVYNGKLIGVTNFVVGGCGSNAPDGYASVAFFASWIRSIIDLN